MVDDQDDQQTGDDQSTTQTTESDQQTSQAQATAQGAAQTTDDQGADQAIQIDQDTVQQALVSQDNQQSQGTSGSTLDWHDVAKRAIAFLQSDTSDPATRTKCMLNHILDGLKPKRAAKIKAKAKNPRPGILTRRRIEW